MAFKYAVLLAVFTTTVTHAKAPEGADQIKVAPPVNVAPGPAPNVPQNMQYHLQMLKQLKTADATTTSGSNSSGTSQSHDYHLARLKLLRQSNAQQMQYHLELLKKLSGAKSPKTADARLDGYLRTYLAEVNAKGPDGEGDRAIDFGGCVIAATYASQSVADARASCAKAVGTVAVADVDVCVKSGNAVRNCVTTAVSTALRTRPTPGVAGGVQFADAKSAPNVAK